MTSTQLDVLDDTRSVSQKYTTESGTEGRLRFWHEGLRGKHSKILTLARMEWERGVNIPFGRWGSVVHTICQWNRTGNI